MLATPPVQPAPDAEDAPRHAGFAAFEQYTDDPAYPCGPWTDVYGLAALAYFLATGSAPPSALARRVRDDCLPLEEWGVNEYDKAFCDAVDSGLAMPAHARPQTMAAFAAAMGALPLREPTVSPVVPPTIALPVDEEPKLAEADPVAQTSPEYPPRRRPRAMPWILACLLLLAAGGVAWMQMSPATVQLAATPQASAPTPAPIPAPQLPEAAPAAQTPSEAQPERQPTPEPDARPELQPTPQPTPPTDLQPASESASQPSSAPEPSRVDSDTGGGAPASAPAAEASNNAPTPATTAAPTTASETPPDAAPKAPPKATPVAVRVAVRPWGEVLINGRSRGVSPPLRELSLTPGRYQVTVRNASAGEHRMTLTVAAGKPASISHEFK
jgi:cytoskeletal protein RodZ